MYNNSIIFEEEKRLINEIAGEKKFTWHKFINGLKLGALTRGYSSSVIY